jgi:hypothetical protein
MSGKATLLQNQQGSAHASGHTSGGSSSSAGRFTSKIVFDQASLSLTSLVRRLCESVERRERVEAGSPGMDPKWDGQERASWKLGFAKTAIDAAKPDVSQ